MLQWADSNDRPDSNDRSAGNRPLVLVIDDDPEILRVFSRALNLAEYSTHTALSAESALTFVRAKRPDAVLVDLKMPYINGIGLLYRLRRLHPHIPVAVITGVYNLDQSTIDEIGALHAPIHLKPLSIGDIQDAARRLLSGELATRAEHAPADWIQQTPTPQTSVLSREDPSQPARP